jgi:hypothetical protein
VQGGGEGERDFKIVLYFGKQRKKGFEIPYDQKQSFSEEKQLKSVLVYFGLRENLQFWTIRLDKKTVLKQFAVQVGEYDHEDNQFSAANLT